MDYISEIERSIDLMFMLGLSETIDQLYSWLWQTLFIDMVMCCGERMVIS